MILKLLAYEEEKQEDMLPGYWEIEHIFPQTWDSKYYTFDEEEANDKLEHIGNKLPLEKKLNISASNNYFDKKKEKYKESKIAVCKKLGNSSLGEWNLNNITNNDEKICTHLKSLFKRWVEGYDQKEATTADTPVPTPEEQAMIDMLRSKGLIQ